MTTLTSVPHSSCACMNTFNPLKNQVFAMIFSNRWRNWGWEMLHNFLKSAQPGKWSCDLNHDTPLTLTATLDCFHRVGPSTRWLWDWLARMCNALNTHQRAKTQSVTHHVAKKLSQQAKPIAEWTWRSVANSHLLIQRIFLSICNAQNTGHRMKKTVRVPGDRWLAFQGGKLHQIM